MNGVRSGRWLPHRWALTAMLLGAQTVAYFHRTLVTLFAEPIRLEYGVSDTAIGILVGAAFSVSYVVAALPLGHIADTSDRFRLLGICIAIWSLLTSLSAAASAFVWLVICRLGIAAAMSGVTPSAGSAISNLFARNEIARPLGLYSSGIHLGVGIAMVAGALLARVLDPFTLFSVGPLGMMSGWKIIFLLAGLPGLMLAGLFLFTRDPARTGTGPVANLAPLTKPFPFPAQWRRYAVPILGLSLLVLVSNAIAAWLPTLFFRKYGWNADDIGLWYGGIVVVAGFIGAASSGFLVALVRKRLHEDAETAVLLVTTFVALPVSVALPLVASPYACLALYFVRCLLGGIIIAVGYALILGHAPEGHRAKIVAAAGIAFNIIGGGLGALSVGLLTDYLFSDPLALPYSIAIVCFVASLSAVAVLGAARFSST